MMDGLRQTCRRAGVLWVACVLATGCVYAPYDNGHMTLTESSYRAADMLSQQTQSQITRETAINVGMIGDIAKPAAVTAFGRTAGSQLAARLVQLGYRVEASSYSEMTGGGTAGAPASVTLTGQYAIAQREILVNLRFLDTASGKVVAAYDYSLPMDSDIRALTKIDGESRGWFGL